MSGPLIIAENEEKYVDTSFNPQSTPLELTTKHSVYPEEFDFATPPVKTTKMVVENELSKYTYPIQMTNLTERENWTISTDHCYAKPWNWRPEANFLRPTKTLFMRKEIPARTKAFNPLAPQEKVEENIDVEAEPELPMAMYDMNKARNLMDECENHARLARNGIEDDDWEEKISKMNWTNTQHKVFNGVLSILDSFHLAKLSYTGHNNEPIIRRTMVDKAVQRVRKLLAGVSWDAKVMQWMHQLFIDYLPMSYLALYLEILQTLKAKLPAFLDKMMYGPTSSVRMGLLNNESLFPLLKRPWDPVSHSLNQDKPKKLPGNPIIIFVPSSPVMSRRAQKWVTLLSHLATVVTVPANFGSSWYRVTVSSCLDQMFSVTKGKLQEIRETYPGRQLILVGCGAGATLALQVAQVEQVLCVVSLGFSLLTAEGRRGEPDDNLLELQLPVLFVVGQCSNTSPQEEMEGLRERMRVETGLIVVGSADDSLRVNKKKKRDEGITQSIVDRCVVDEIGEFVSGVILSPFPPQIRQSPTATLAEAVKKGKHERKRYSSNASSIDSEPPSPTTRLSRPVGRPPGSKAKSKLEAKWAQQVAQGTAPPSPPPTAPSTPPPPPTPAHNPVTPNSSETSSATESPVPYASGRGSTPTGDVPPPLPPLRKIRTLLPVVADKAEATARGPAARMQAYNLNRNINPSGQLSTLLQGGIKTIPPVPKPSSGIKVLEDLTLTSGTTAKLISASGKLDLSKLNLINTVSSAKGAAASMGNVLLLPNGKIKAVHGNLVKGVGNPMMVPVSPKGTKYATPKKQFITKPIRLPKRPQPYIPPPAPIQTNLPPPTNLTPNDIMDLPIIFADDNQIIDPNMPTDLTTTNKQNSQPPLQKLINPPPMNKYLLVTKPGPNSSNFIITPSAVKRPTPLNFSKQPAKYAKIILSKKTEDIIPRLSSEITLKKVEKVPEFVEAIDLENELVATAVPKPNLATSTVKNITIIPKKSGEFAMPSLSIQQTLTKVTETAIEDDDPDYVPPKNLKM